MSTIENGLFLTLLISLRLLPTIQFAPPFTLVRAPAQVKLLLSIGIAGWLSTITQPLDVETYRNVLKLLALAASELLIGIAMSLSFHIAYAAIYTMGRLIDLQAGFSFATLVDPTNKSQLPMIGTILAYSAGIIFFTTDAPADLIAIWANSMELAPVGSLINAEALPKLLSYTSAVYMMAIVIGFLLVMVLFILDIAIAIMSRSLPQMNVLILGFQVKTLATIALLPLAISLSMAACFKITRYALEATTQLA